MRPGAADKSSIERAITVAPRPSRSSRHLHTLPRPPSLRRTHHHPYHELVIVAFVVELASWQSFTVIIIVRVARAAFLLPLPLHHLVSHRLPPRQRHPHRSLRYEGLVTVVDVAVTASE